MTNFTSDAPKVARNYFDRLLARALALPADSPQELFDDPFEQVAPWPLDTVAVSPTVIAAAHVVPKSNVPATPATQAIVPPHAELNLSTTSEKSLEQSQVSESNAADFVDEIEAIAVNPMDTPLPPPASRTGYLNQDDLLSTADAFIRNLPLTQLPAALRSDEAVVDVLTPTVRRELAEMSVAERHRQVAEATPSLPLPAVQAVAVAQARLQPPTPEVAAAATKKSQIAIEKKEPQPPSAAQRDASAPSATPVASQTVIAVITDEMSTAARHANDLNASARFGIGQL